MRVRLKGSKMRWTDEEVAWIAGVIEAKGIFSLQQTKFNDYPRVQVQVKLKDVDIIENLHFLIGGTITYRGIKNGRTKYVQLNLYRQIEIEELFKAIYPWMGQRRQDKIDILLGSYEGRVAEW